MVLEELVRVLGEESVAFVNQAVGEFSKLCGLVVGDEKLGGGDAGEFVFQQSEIGELENIKSGFFKKKLLLPPFLRLISIQS